MKRLLMLIFAFTVAAFGADVNGTWKATAEGPSGTRLLFDGNSAPILYAGVGQMSAVVPFSVAKSDHDSS
jgi:uncharacterized protein (TIGR03437 family)